MTKKKDDKNEKSHIETVTDRIGEVAINYGFTVVKPPHISQDDVSKSKQFRSHDHYGDIEEKVALTRWYMENEMDKEAQPVAIHFKKPLPGSSIRKKPNQEVYGFEIMGSPRSTSEALLIKCVLGILDDLGYKDLVLDINSIGDKESINKFERDLNNHFKKNGHLLPAKLRQEFKKNIYTILKNGSEETKEFKQGAPQTIAVLSEISRTHFKEVLESIEMFEVPYKINPGIVSNKNYASYTVFEIKQISDKKNEDGELLAYGYRYNHLAKKIGGKREVPTIGATILVKKSPKSSKKVLIKNIKKPNFYLVQLGSLAKLKALNIVELLRKNKINVYHSITKDKITGQLSGAEYMKATHVLIMGQKEAIENSVVVRDLINREQNTVSIERLPEFLKALGEEKVVKKKK
ncbi:MAG: His/Gly/Thr/Pro-type tRNA ligase C-terminal domain-containing protein [Minisyncoccia bacterium]